MTDKFDWAGQAGDSWAAEWRRTDRSFGMLTERLLRRSREHDFNKVLDIGCGAGEISLAIARSRNHAKVVGVDISPRLIETARERGINHPNASFELADASQWMPEEGFAPDFLVSRHGVMFFEDPVAAFAHLSSIAAPGAALLFSCFRDLSANSFFTEIGKLLPRQEKAGDPKAPGPFAFADRQHVENILLQGGWHDISFESFDFGMIAGAGSDPIEDAVGYYTTIGPAARMMPMLADEERESFLDDLRGLLEQHCHDGIVLLRAAAWIVSARNGQ
ncbi:SAM-dependent methyltransferase [Altererythrobacter atlanticus]|uniref:Malonyl-[acyl-carrier protein] O-methyltransferase n=1 Tax=Croceibacterium atlanticum TaxID=1267766 RepID=A0A0F7KQ17_9SPHN|nr:class I SAM-dependent methyltransferase [Croceibacterium atlanticum]AKH41226.1 Malonyl-[acyl-carrier protein] O-methyltransferase [Croceibacterium atlanticum]MBB5732744.1 SAM-dependent methyltransferase [Croceibacterium atlanticum]